MSDSPRRRRPSDEDDEASPRRRSRSRDEDDDRDYDPAEDDRPRRRSGGREEEDERPRRPRSYRDDDDDEGRPRRRRRSPSVGGGDGRTKLLMWGGIGALVLVGLAIAGVVMIVRNVKRAPFREHLPTYLASPVGNPGAGGPVGKVVVVDVQGKDVDGLHFDLPDDLRAANPAEVKTVVQLNWDKKQVGTYSGGGNAYQWYCTVTVMDLASKARIGGTTVSGSRPPSSVRGRRGQSHSGDKPTDAVLNFIRNLPRG